MSVVNLPQNGPVFIPGENPGDPGTLILPFEGAGIDVASGEKATGLVLSVAEYQITAIQATLNDNPGLLSSSTSTILKVLGHNQWGQSKLI